MTIIRGVSLTLRRLLTPIYGDESLIVFDSPADILATDNRRLSVFIYQVVENSYLRNVEPEPVDLDKLKYPPLALDLYYIFTPYDTDREAELVVLERLMQMLHDTSVLKGSILDDSLVKSGNTEIRVVPNNLTFEEINKLWERFPNRPYKLSASYILTPVKIPSAKEPAKTTRVIERDIDVHRKEIKV